MTRTQFVNREARRVFNIKIDLEKTMRRDLRSYFNQQRKIVRRDGTPSSIKPVLQKHYERIIRNLIHKNIKQEDRIENAVRAFLDNRADVRSQEIDETTQNRVAQAVEKARVQLAEEGNVNPTNRELMIAASVIFARSSRGRVNTIALTETQNNVEGLRQLITREAHGDLEDVIRSRDKKKAQEIYEQSRDYTSYQIKEKIDTADIATLTAILLAARKRWMTMGDSKVRSFAKGDEFDHVTANGQERMLNEAYIVSGQLLMYPGDTSLGASSGNVINCRCVSVNL